MSKIKNYVKATAYKVAVLLDLVDDNQQLRDGNTISLLKDGTPVSEANTPINLVFNKNDDGKEIFVDGFLNGTAISTAHLYSNMSILENAVEIVGHQLSPYGNYFTLTFNNIANAPATGITEWNTFFTTSTKANTGFTHYDTQNNSGLLYGPSALTLKQNLFKSNTAITSISDMNIINNIESTSKNNGVFYQCINLTSVFLLKVINIGNYAFYGCASLSNINFPLATTIGEYTFKECVSLSSVNISSATVIGTWAFGTCTTLSNITSTSVTGISNSAFQGCTSLSSVTFPSTISIGNNAFANCTSLAQINLSSCTIIGTNPFVGVSGNTIDMWIPLTSTGSTGFGTFFTDNTVHLNP